MMMTWWYWGRSGHVWFPTKPPSPLSAPRPRNSSQPKPPLPYAAKCAGTTAYGRYLGVSWSNSGTYVNGGAHMGYVQEAAQYTCIDPPRYKDSRLSCAATVNATATFKSPQVSMYTYYNSGVKNSAFADSGYKDLALCGTEFRQTFGSHLKKLGQYELKTNGTQVTCTIRSYTEPSAKTGKLLPTKILGCANWRPYMHAQVQWQVWCNGWSKGWGGSHSFTMDECRGTGPWTCGTSIDRAPTYNSVHVPATGISVLDDGLKRAATWAGPTPGPASRVRTGSVSSKTVQLDLAPLSLPYRSSEPVNGATQPFIVDRPLNTLLEGWNNTWKVGFQAPNAASQAWTVAPTWAFTADFKVTIVKSIKVNWKTGTFKVTPAVVWVPDAGTCMGKDLNVSVKRAHNVR